MTRPAVPLTELLAESSIRLGAIATDRDDALTQAGRALIGAGAVDPAYLHGMLERENSVSTYVGEGVAMPHSILDDRDSVKRDALSLIQLPEGVDWDGNEVHIVVGIAAKGRGHIRLLSRLATVLLDPAAVERLRAATTTAEVYDVLADGD